MSHLRLLRRYYATAPAAQMSAKARKAVEASLGGDSRNQLLKRILFDTPPREYELSEEQLAKVQVIERAWKLECDRLMNERQRILERQWKKMQEAHDELYKLDKRLYQVANNFEHGKLFPRQMRAPTMTPPTEGWNYAFKAPTNKSS
jgi:large subunit ribosomal protein L40